jgi:hypothetical protein
MLCLQLEPENNPYSYTNSSTGSLMSPIYIQINKGLGDKTYDFNVLIREDVKVLPFADFITKAALSTQLF